MVGYDYLLNLDGGTSTDFFVNGRGMLHNVHNTDIDGSLGQTFYTIGDNI